MIWLGGLLGALSVFILGVVREWWLQRQEFKGLTHLFSTEVSTIQKWFDIAPMERFDVFTPKKLKLFEADVWPDARVRLAQLMHPDDFAALADYYRALLIFVNHLQDEVMREEDVTYKRRDQLNYQDVVRTGQKAQEILQDPRMRTSVLEYASRFVVAIFRQGSGTRT